MDKNKDWIDKLSDEDISYCLKNSKSIYKTPAYLKTSVINMIQAGKSAEVKKKNNKKGLFYKPFYRYAFSLAVLLVVILAGLYITVQFIIKPSNTNICKITDLSGKSYIIDKNTNEKIYLSVGEKLAASSIITTNEGAILKFNIGDKIKVTVEENSKIELSKLFKSEEKEESILNVIFGKSIFDIDKLNKTDLFAVDTESLSVTVKGTEFAVSVSETGESKVSVDTGIVSIKTRMKIKHLDVIESLNADIGKKIKDIVLAEVELAKNNEFSINKEELKKAENEINIIAAQIRKDLEENKDISNIAKRLENQIDEIDTIKNILIGRKSPENDINQKDLEYKENIKIVKQKNNPGIKLTEKNTGISTDGRNIYISSDSNKAVYCIDPDTGKLKWTFKNTVLKKITSSAVIFNNEIFISTPGSIINLTKNGELKKNYPISNGTNYWAKSLKINNSLYIPTFRTIYKYNNNQINSLENLPEIMGQLYISSNDNNIIIADSNEQKIKIYNLESKNINWISDKLIGRILTEPLLIGKYIFAADMNNSIYRWFNYDSQETSPKVLNIGTGVMTNLIYTDNKLCFVGNNGIFYVINPFSFDGITKRYKVEQNAAADKFLSKELILDGNDIFYSSDTGKIFHFNTINNRIEMLQISDNINNSPLIGSPVKIGNGIFFLDSESNIYKLTKEKNEIQF